MPKVDYPLSGGLGYDHVRQLLLESRKAVGMDITAFLDDKAAALEAFLSSDRTTSFEKCIINNSFGGRGDVFVIAFQADTEEEEQQHHIGLQKWQVRLGVQAVGRVGLEPSEFS